MNTPTLRELAKKMTDEWEVPSIHEHFESLYGSGEILEKDYNAMLAAALKEEPNGDDALEIIGPIATAILCEAASEDKEVYMELLQAIKKAHDQYTAWRIEKEFILDVNKDSEEDIKSKLDTVHAMLNSGHWALREHDDSKVDVGYVRYLLIRSKRP